MTVVMKDATAPHPSSSSSNSEEEEDRRDRTPRRQQQPERDPPLVRFSATPVGPKCPFGHAVEFALHPGGCVSLRGPSGRGKTTLATVLAGIGAGDGGSRGTRSGGTAATTGLQIDVRCEWDPSIPPGERCGVLFQQTTLLDDLTVAGNLAVALRHHRDRFSTPDARRIRIKQLLDMVGLEYDRDANKRPSELSGGMGRRACLAMQLAQRKRVVVLDEPFTGLDHEAAVGVAKELVRLRLSRNRTALLLISHEPYLTDLVMAEDRTDHNQVVDLTAPPPSSSVVNSSHHHDAGGDPRRRSPAGSGINPSLFGISFGDRFLERLVDYTMYSLPLIALAFVA
jgi:ABC-type nitrate/sulfonate/bicarbonate transport system ATPase subunit